MSDEEVCRDPTLDLSVALLGVGIEHKVKVMPCDDDAPLYSIEGIHGFTSVTAFASACEQAGFDAVYSAGTGWAFVTSRAEHERRVREATQAPKREGRTDG